jgi:hypothetical protein
MPNTDNPNEERADRAQTVIDMMFSDDEGVVLRISDVIADLHHLADRHSLRWESLINRAESSYDSDVFACGEVNPA